MNQNSLSQETSPYLLQHQDNPVHWQVWGEDAFQAAQEAGKPILLSVGYAACHWCHEMAHESFEDPKIAALMNELFINIKVDREERPDIDHIYQSALAMMGEQGGWPLTMFLTPEGDPFWGGTYFPPSPRYGRPGFPDLLMQISATFKKNPERIEDNVKALREGLKSLARPEGGGALSVEVLDQTASLLLRSIDPHRGGTIGAPKFPQPSLFSYLWRAQKRAGSPLYREAVTLTLDHICQGGIYDHLGGGFARYSTDEVWLAPHFEKMLYDNALLIELLAEVGKTTQSALYEIRIRETVDWALRDLRNGDGGLLAFASAYDADSEGEEGRFYVWSEAEIDALLGDDGDPFKTVYDVTAGGNWEGKTILNRSRRLELLSDEAEGTLAAQRRVLLERRAERVPPGRDDKVLADWNGMMIAALSRVSAVFDEPDWLEAAMEAYLFVRERMTVDGRLRHAWCAGRANHPASIDDYANMARAALNLHEVTGAADYLDHAIDWVAVADKHYWDDEGGGYFLGADDTGDVIARLKTVHDNATPPGNGTILEVLARLYLITGNRSYRERADALITALMPKEIQGAVHHLSILAGFEFLDRAVQVVLIGTDPDGIAALRRAYFRTAPPTAILMTVDGDQALPDGHPTAGKTAIDGKATAYVCIGTTCGLPVTEAEDLAQQLAEAGVDA